MFYNRRLRRLVAIELKLGEFKAADKGQMALYLRWLAKHEQEPGEAPPLAILLCTGKNHEQIELLELDQSEGIYGGSGNQRDMMTIPCALFDRLTETVCCAA